MDNLRQDLTYAMRALRRQPAFAALAIQTLAVGIGATAAIFSVVDAVLLRPLAYNHPDRIVALTTLWRKTGARGTVSAPDFHDWHDQSKSFSAMAYYAGGETSVSVDGVADYATATIVTPEFFDVFGVGPEIGHVPTAADQRSSDFAAVVGHEFWERRFGGRPDVLGRTISLQQRTFTIEAVMPPGFHFPDRADVWVPASAFDETTSRSGHNYYVAARLAPGVTVERAQAEMTAIAAHLEQQYPVSNATKGAAVVPLQEELVGSTRATLYLLFGAVALVLLIACANVANLLLARATARSSELAVRAALGAGRGRIVAQLLTESVTLAVAAGVVGLLLARWGVGALLALAPAGLPRAAEIAVDWRVAAFALGASIAAAVIFGVAPALQASRVDLNAVLRQGGRGEVGGGSGALLRNALVVVEIAFAVALVVGASLLIRSFETLARVDLGFRQDHLLVAESTVPSNNLASARAAMRFYATVLDKLTAVPGVRSAAAVRGLPATAIHASGGYWLEGGPGPDAGIVAAPQAMFTVVTPDYFKTMGVPVLRGREFSARDAYDAPRVAIINEALARQSFPNADPIGHRIEAGLDSPEFMTIVGVVGNVRQRDPARPPSPELYYPFEQHPGAATSMRIVARTAVEPAAIAARLREIARAENSQVPLRIGTMDDTMSTAVATPRFRTLLVGVFAALAFVLAMAGVYGVMAYAVSRRRAEIGVRMALGAASTDVLRLVLRDALRLALAGIVLGCGLAFAVAQGLRGMLFGVQPADPFVFVAVPIALLLTAVLASAVPARRAAAIDPMLALRAD
jgi:predicted permease